MEYSRRRFLQYSSLVGLDLVAQAFLPRRGLVLSSPQATPFPLTLQLDWRLNVQFAGVLLADQAGLYAEQGLAVTVEPWQSGLVVLDAVAQDPGVIGCAEQNLILAAQVAGAPIRAIGAMFQVSPLALMVLPDSGITSLADLPGQTVGVHGDGLKVMALVQGVMGMPADALQVVEIPYEGKYDRLLSRELAAIQCYAIDEPLGFEQQTGIVPGVLNLGNYGYEAYGQVLFTHTQLLEQSPVMVKRFLRATFAGWQRALADIPAAARLVVDRYVDPASPYHNLTYQTQSLEHIADYVLGELEPTQIGRIDGDRWQRMAERFAMYGAIAGVPPLNDAIAANLWPIT